MTEYQEMKARTYSILQEDGESIEVAGDDIFALPDGKLTTMYHYMKAMNEDEADKTIEEATNNTEEVNA